ncbi:phosphatase [Candidatus Francisella endociliophora]|uniref:undecaprenyl-diphosphate phosphatase n=1 Tax=Candidatus Francisella endociliophora TaxID=653937 RepID=A0A097EP05_9GAMM|nr:phosphatase PAP2 family protein [Francisella sp. FSC1006]AIT09294.1 phosphatase [Francisella sp. FSC1006]
MPNSVVKKNWYAFKKSFKSPRITEVNIPRLIQLKYTFVPILLIIVFLYFNIDAYVEKYVQNGFFSGYWYYLDKITHFGLALYLLIPLGLFAIVRLFIDTDSLLESTRDRINALTAATLFLIATVAISGIIGQILKFMIGRARPKFFLEYGSQYFEHFHKPGYDFASMPSGHSITVAAFYVGLIYLLPRFRVLWVFLALLIAFSRVALGSHYPSDVIFGLAVGAYTTIFIYYWMRNRNFLKPTNTKKLS